MNHDIIAGIITYNPDMGRLKENIDRIIAQVDEVLIVDNGSTNLPDIDKLACKYNGLKIEANGINMGIAHAMNQVGDEAVRSHKQFFLTLDQDSVADDGMVDDLLILFNDETIGGVSPYVNTCGKYVPEPTIADFKTVISSGFIVRTNLWKKIGGYWEYLFIDEVDHEFCYRIREKGYRIVRKNDVSIDHRLGETKKKRILGHVFNPSNHSAFRRYYIARNNVILNRLFAEDDGSYSHVYKMLLNTAISILLCENDKMKKIEAIIRGIYDGKKWYRNRQSVIVRRGKE